jgi:hypothetical protein
MSKTALKTAESRSLLHELARAGSPVDLSVAERVEKVVIEQVGGIAESMVFELEDGRVAVMAEIAVTNLTAEPINVIGIDLQAPWGESLWQWLEPTQIQFKDRTKGDCSFPIYRFPGKCAMELPYDEVINHLLVGPGRRRLPGKCQLDRWLLGIGGSMPAGLFHGQWLDFSITIITSDHAECTETIHLWTDRLETRPKAVAPRGRFSEHGILPAREVARSGNHPVSAVEARQRQWAT